jgi:hypothetical protein
MSCAITFNNGSMKGIPVGKFRKKPVVIEAVQFIDEPTEVEGEEPYWYSEARTIEGDEVGSVNYEDGVLLIHTLEGVMRANVGDWVIRGVKGELYPCKPDIFAATYEAVDE